MSHAVPPMMAYCSSLPLNRQLVRLPAKAEGQASLCVCIDRQHLPARLRQPYAQVGAGRRFGCAALLVGKTDNVRIHFLSSFLFFIVSKSRPLSGGFLKSEFPYASFAWEQRFFLMNGLVCINWRKIGVWRILPKNKKA